MRTIFHIDVNSAFLSWEAAERLKNGDTVDIREIPAVIGGDEKSRQGIVLAKSIPAKAFGIKTGEPLMNARKKCPNLLVVPSNYALYSEYSKKLHDYLGNFSPSVESFSIDECFLDYTGMERHFGTPMEAAEKIKQGIFENFGFTVNIGVSENKLLAKMASDFEKPNKIHALYRAEIAKKMWPLPVGDLFMVGRRSATQLEKMGITTIGDLANTDIETLTYYFKSQGNRMWSYANGIDPSPVEPPPPVKGIGNSVTLPKDAETEEDAFAVFLELAELVGTRLRKEGTTAGLISIQLRSQDFQNYSHQRKLLQPTNITQEIYQIATELFQECWNKEPLRLLGISTTHLVSTDQQQTDLFHSEEGKNELDTAVDTLRKRYGDSSIKRGRSMISTVKIRRRDDHKK